MDDIELIKSKINIVDLIQEYLPLKKSGVNFKANCPFHQEHTPSFVVSPERGIWHCFGCDKGGDAFKFVMEKEGIEFKDALEMLAQKAGVVLKKTPKKEDSLNDRLFALNTKAAQFFHYLLMEHPLGKKALDYLHKRGLIDETIKLFNIGYAPNSWETLTKFLKKRGFKTEELILSGICVASKNGCYDRFRGRVVFPLVDVRGKIMGFSGRVLDGSEPKYINSPQTPIFDKGRFLLGLNLAKGIIKEKNEAVVVEGEMDMILSYQSGIKNIVASKGTALTEYQVEALKKYADTISLCFDTDLAGDAAARRGIEIADRAGFNIKAIRLVGVKDPAEAVLKDPKVWAEAIETATPIYDYYLESVIKRFNPKTASGKRAVSEELLPIWKKISDPLTKEHYIQKLSALLLVKDEFIREELENLPTQIKTVSSLVQNKPEEIENKKEIKLVDRRSLLEEYLISLLLHIPKDHIFIPNFPETLFTSEELKQIYVLLVIFLDSISFRGKSFKIGEFVKDTPAQIQDQVDRLFLMQIDEKLNEKNAWQKEVEIVIEELKKMLIKSSLEKLSLQIKSAQEFGKMDELTLLNKRFRDLSVKLKHL